MKNEKSKMKNEIFRVLTKELISLEDEQNSFFPFHFTFYSFHFTFFIFHF